MNIEIDRDRCVGYGVCAQSAPALFELDDEGDPVVLHPEPLAGQEAAAELAARSCPTYAVRIQ